MTIKDLSDLKITMVQEIEVIRKESLHGIVQHRGKWVSLCVSVKGDDFRGCFCNIFLHPSQK